MPSQSTETTQGLITQILNFQHISNTSKLWLLLGVGILISAIFVYFLEKSKHPKVSNVPIKNLRLTPSQVSFLLQGPLKPENSLAATFLDWNRKGWIQENTLTESGFLLKEQPGPITKSEEYLIDFLQKHSKGRNIDFSLIGKSQKNQGDEFYSDLNQWYYLLKEELIERNLLYPSHRNHGNTLVYGLLSIAFYFIGFIGIWLKIQAALLTLVGATIYFFFALKTYGKLPTTGQSVYTYLQPLRKGETRTFSGDQNLNSENLRLYAIALGSYKKMSSNLSETEKSLEDEFINSFIENTKKTFIGSVSFQII
ncbi:DUF2207 domain-containing protein [Peptoniphilus sp. KCTC 25270]|uniref:DUF2207 family protein n=1 Tax=Peptoniphilus sp. KCTC 25270 TaxID=2897414 RepID=UPI001E50C9A8|nr:DUF2207 domain-containing protein [Peptoniphilus sp. KCTC 25270]MCD1146510.1 DUF2207 domain-containing protein [Peptoniphilus sp. KCTC 25270]